MATPEGLLKKECIAVLEQTNLLWWTNFLGPIIKGNGRRAPNPNKGMPDLTIIQKSTGRHIFVELKSKDGKLSKEQVEWQERCDKSNLPVFVVYELKDFYKAVNFAVL